MVRYIVDRFEGDMAVVEDMETRQNADIPRAILPDGVREGDVLTVIDDRWVVDEAETAARAERIRARFARLRKVR